MNDELSFRRRLLEALDLELPDFRDPEGDAAADIIVRRVKAFVENATRAREDASLWRTRFAVLSQNADEDFVKEAMEDVAPSSERMSLLRALDPKNFLGTGMSLDQMLLSHRITQFRRSFVSQIHSEQRRRLDLVVRLSSELVRVRREDLQGTARLEQAVEGIIVGEPIDEFEERIGWMLDREMARPVGLDSMGEGKRAAWLAQEERHMRLWAPAVRICREYVDTFNPPPKDLPSYADEHTMMSAESGWVTPPGTENLFVPDLSAFEKGRWWGSLRADFLHLLFKAGIRWRGPSETRNGYWHRYDCSAFEGIPATEPRYRLFILDELLRWFSTDSSREKETENP